MEDVYYSCISVCVCVCVCICVCVCGCGCGCVGMSRVHNEEEVGQKYICNNDITFLHTIAIYNVCI